MGEKKAPNRLYIFVALAGAVVLAAALAWRLSFWGNRAVVVVKLPPDFSGYCYLVEDKATTQSNSGSRTYEFASNSTGKIVVPSCGFLSTYWCEFRFIDAAGRQLPDWGSSSMTPVDGNFYGVVRAFLPNEHPAAGRSCIAFFVGERRSDETK